MSRFSSECRHCNIPRTNKSNFSTWGDAHGPDVQFFTLDKLVQVLDVTVSAVVFILIKGGATITSVGYKIEKL